jgi:hypothetical protein
MKEQKKIVYKNGKTTFFISIFSCFESNHHYYEEKIKNRIYEKKKENIRGEMLEPIRNIKQKFNNSRYFLPPIFPVDFLCKESNLFFSKVILKSEEFD